MPEKKLREFLDDQGIQYRATPHEIAYTARQTATVTHVPNKELAKTVIVKIDGVLAMAVLPASYMVDLSLLRAATGARSVSLAKESEFQNWFPECEIGAMPPFGKLYGMRVYVDESLTKDEHISFNAGSHYELLEISYADFERLVKPRTLKFTGLRDPELL
jgi:Ala-tRNA(Pro) deacylase